MKSPIGGDSPPAAPTAEVTSETYADVFRLSPNPYVLLDTCFHMVEMNQAYLDVTMRSREDLVGRGIFDAFPSDPASPHGRELRESLARARDGGRRDHIPLIRYAIPTPGGGLEERFWSATHTPVLGPEGKVAFILQHTVDVTELTRLRAAAANQPGLTTLATQVEGMVLRRAQSVEESSRALQQKHDELRRLFAQAPGFIAVLEGPDHRFAMANDAYRLLVGNRDVVGKLVHEALPEVANQGFVDLLHEVYTTGRPYVGRRVRVELQHEAGGALEERFLDFLYQPIRRPDGAVSGIFVQGHDLTEQLRAEDALRELNATLERQIEERTRELQRHADALRQAQKMEAVGQLTGGIAHDFNNLLQIILGNLEILNRMVPADAPRMQRAVENATSGARRAATLTLRLLAFSRRQPLDPRALDVNSLVTGMSDLLHRTLGETVAVETVLAAGLWRTEVDPNQLESALLNLAVNARDAMPSGGKLTIETANTRIDEAYVAAHAEVVPGQYVVICVSDTGAGIDPDTMGRVFEPFFTTKEPGKGTGLGLSQVYGFVKQSGGHVKIYSEPGEGTTVKIYLPRSHKQARDEPIPADEAVPDSEDGETILVVEDDAGVRAFSCEILRELGYTVIEAPDGPSALRLVETRPDIDLLFTDLVLPGGLTGAETAAKARELRPALAVLFTTGYARNAVVHQGRLNDEAALVVKPFTYAELAAKVRAASDKGR